MREHKFKKGEVVIEKTRPTNRLIISRFDNGMYYCKAEEGMERKELVYLERDLRYPLSVNSES